MTSFKSYTDLNFCLNIEGCRPYSKLPQNCSWFNIALVLDSPIYGHSFNEILEKSKESLIEGAIDNFSTERYLDQLTCLIFKIKNSEKYKNILIHVHQYSGATNLHHILTNRTGILAVTDITNYYECSIDYTNSKFDCLISLSLCASVSKEYLPGSFVVPKNYYYFDVNHKIVSLIPSVFSNEIEDYLDEITYQECDMLVVDDLWNPIEDFEEEGVLLLDERDLSVLEFVKESTKIFDSSHNWEHAVKVAYNSTKILNNKFVLYLALLHDVCDHKYPNSIPRSELSKFINEKLQEYSVIDSMIEQVSFSKQRNFDPVDPILQAVRDGDRIEAIGEIGISRCITVTELRGGRVPEDVIQHCFDKLLRLLPEGYISSEKGREIAKKHHNIIVDYVRNNSSYLPDYLE